MRGPAEGHFSRLCLLIRSIAFQSLVLNGWPSSEFLPPSSSYKDDLEHLKVFENCEGEYKCVGVTEALEFVGPSIGEEVSEEELKSFRDDMCTEGTIISVSRSFGESEKYFRIGHENIRFGKSFRRRTFYIDHHPNRIGIHTKAIHSRMNNKYF